MSTLNHPKKKKNPKTPINKTEVGVEKEYHSVEIGEAINQSGGLSETLLKGIAEIVSRVGGDNQNRGANPREKDRENGATGGLAHTTFASHEYPFQRLLLHYVL